MTGGSEGLFDKVLQDEVGWKLRFWGRGLFILGLLNIRLGGDSLKAESWDVVKSKRRRKKKNGDVVGETRCWIKLGTWAFGVYWQLYVFKM